MSETPEPETGTSVKRIGATLAAFLIPFAFVWIVFDNLALALIIAVLFAGGSEAAQRAGRKPGDAPPSERNAPGKD